LCGTGHYCLCTSASHPDTATNLKNQAILSESQGRYEEAESLYQRAFLIAEEQLGASQTDTARNMYNLAGFYRSLGRDEEAEPLMKQALLISEKQLVFLIPIRQIV
jgi:tetratricopeptide (TPR) repeat protein